MPVFELGSPRRGGNGAGHEEHGDRVAKCGGQAVEEVDFKWVSFILKSSS
jgi:hypothetical protein